MDTKKVFRISRDEREIFWDFKEFQKISSDFQEFNLRYLEILENFLKLLENPKDPWKFLDIYYKIYGNFLKSQKLLKLFCNPLKSL